MASLDDADTFWDVLRLVWWFMLELPWRHSGPDNVKDVHWILWTIGWAWTIAGLALGALVAPLLTQTVGLTDSPYTDWLTIAVAVFAGFLVQLVGWALYISLYSRFIYDHLPRKVLTGLAMAEWFVPFAGVGYGIYRYLIWVGSDQRTVTIAFVGGLLIKTFAIPLIKGILTGALFRWFMHWLHGDKDTKKAKIT